MNGRLRSEKVKFLKIFPSIKNSYKGFPEWFIRTTSPYSTKFSNTLSIIETKCLPLKCA